MSQPTEAEGFRRRHFTLRHIVVSFVSQKLFGNYTYTIRHGLAVGMRRKGGLGFLPLNSQETAETRFLRQLPLAGKVVYDIGAFEGVLTLFLARQAKQVISWEPNPRNYTRCVENVRLNGLMNVRVFDRGISNKTGTIDLLCDPLMPGAGSGDEAIKWQIGASVKSASKVRIPVAKLDDEVAERDLPLADLIKIDIEGMELQALQGMLRILVEKQPDLYVEMHGATTKDKIENAQAVIAYLNGLGYRIYDVEHADFLTPTTLGDRRPGHIYCSCSNFGSDFP
jgi:FkbM family methyltransferase